MQQWFMSTNAVPENGGETTELEVYDFKGDGGIALAMYNTDEVCSPLFYDKYNFLF